MFVSNFRKMRCAKNVLILVMLISSSLAFAQEDYISGIKKQIENNTGNKILIKKLSDSELSKFKRSKDSLHYIASKYAKLFTLEADGKDKIEHFILLTELLRANNDNYQIITTDVNLALALHFENYSQDMSFTYLNKAIENEEKLGKTRSLPHLYHIKGRLYYNEGKMDKAMAYFQKALSLFPPADYLYIASMHNNFALVYEKQKQFGKAAAEYKRAISILSAQKNLKPEASGFLSQVNENLANLYLLDNKPADARIILEKLFYANRDIPRRLSNVVLLSNSLYKIYTSENNIQKTTKLISFLSGAENKTDDLNTSLIISEILGNYYFKTAQYDKARSYHFKIINIKDSIMEKNIETTNRLGDSLNKTIIKNTNQKYDYQIRSQRVQTVWITVIGVIIILFLLHFFITATRKRRRESEISHQQRIISDQKELIFEKDLKIQEEKIRNLHLNLNIKQETEKAFLEKIKKIRKSNLNNAEAVLKELYFDLNNLINIDKRNIDFTEQSSAENQSFVRNLSLQYPMLSQQELQLCIYFRLNLSAKEISMLEKITDGSVRVYKSKIKSKMGISKDRSIEEFLQNMS